MILYWNIAIYVHQIFSVRTLMIIMHSFSSAKKYEKSQDKSHQKCISVLCHFYKQYKFVENYVFDIYSQKPMEKNEYM